MRKLGEVIRYYRKKGRISQKELAEQAGLSANSMVGIELGRHVPSEEALNKISKSLNIPIPVLLLSQIEEGDFKKEYRPLYKTMFVPFIDCMEGGPY